MANALTAALGGLGGGVVGSAIVNLLLDTTKFDVGLTRSQAALARTARAMSSTGDALTRGVSVPIALAGGIAVKFALDYENAFTKIAAVTNTSQEQVGQWKEQVLSLAGKTAQAPEELADALYFLASAGLDANQIMPTLAASAKASAAGLGETADIARLTANALNAYSATGLKASKVTDILVAAIREGTAEPDEFANAMGRILPIASKASVSFDEVAASLASLSNIGLDVNEGVTAMRGVLQTLLAPTTKAKDALKEMGITADELRDSLSGDGIIATLRLLEEASGGNIDTMNAIIGNVRALTGAFGLTTQEAEKVDAIFKRVAGSTGSLDKAFDKTRKGPMFQFEQTLTRLKVVAIQVGQDLLPVVTDIVKQIGRWVREFGKLDPSTRQMIIKVALLAAALGPLLSITGRLVGIVANLSRVLGVGSGKLGAYALAAGSVAVAVVKVNEYLKLTDEQAKKWTNSVLSGQEALRDYGEQLDALAADPGLFPRLNGTQKALDAINQTVLETTVAWNRMAIEQGASAEGAFRFQEVMAGAEAITRKEQRSIAALIASHTRFAGELDTTTVAQLRNLLAVGDTNAAMDILIDRILDATRGLKNMLPHETLLAEKTEDANQKLRIQADYLRGIDRASGQALGALKNMLSYERQLAEATADANQHLARQGSYLRGLRAGSVSDALANELVGGQI